MNFNIKIAFVVLSMCLNIHLMIATNTIPSDTLYIMSYNVFNGFEHGNRAQEEKFLNFITNQQVDVLALQELVDINAGDLQKLGEKYGHTYSAIVKEKGYPVGITSRFPITVVSKHVEGFWHGMLHVRTGGFDIIVTHLSPFQWEFRHKEAQQIIKYIQEKDLKNCLIMGDLNAHSPFDAEVLIKHDALLKQMQQWDKDNPQYGNLRQVNYDYSVISAFLAEGFDDVIGRMVHPAAKRMTFPAAFLYGWEWNDPRLHNRTERLDYILVNSELFSSCLSANVHNGPEAEGISDHYPVSIKILSHNQPIESTK